MCYDAVIVTMFDCLMFEIWCIVNAYLHKCQMYINTLFTYLPNIDREILLILRTKLSVNLRAYILLTTKACEYFYFIFYY